MSEASVKREEELQRIEALKSRLNALRASSKPELLIPTLINNSSPEKTEPESPITSAITSTTEVPDPSSVQSASIGTKPPIEQQQLETSESGGAQLQSLEVQSASQNVKFTEELSELSAKCDQVLHQTINVADSVEARLLTEKQQLQSIISQLESTISGINNSDQSSLSKQITQQIKTLSAENESLSAPATASHHPTQLSEEQLSGDLELLEKKLLEEEQKCSELLQELESYREVPKISDNQQSSEDPGSSPARVDFDAEVRTI